MKLNYDPKKWEKQESGFLKTGLMNLGASFGNFLGSGATGIGALIKGQQGKYYPDGNAPKNAEAEFFMDIGKDLHDWATKKNQEYGPSEEHENLSIPQRLTSWKYISDPRGLTADVMQGVGSSIPFFLASYALSGAPIIGGALRGASALPSLGIRAGAAKIGNNALGRGINALMDKGLDQTLRTGIYYGGTTAPMDAYINSAEMYNTLKKQGYNDAEIYNRMIRMTQEEIPYDIAFNALTGATLFGKGFGNLGKTRKGRFATSLLNIPAEMLSEYYQEGNQERLTRKYSNLPYTQNLSDGFQTPEELRAARAGALGAVGMAGGGVVKRAAEEGYSHYKEKKQYEQIEPKLHDWAKEISGNSKADGDIDLIISNAKKLNYTPEETKLALALATAESNINQGVTSSAGAIGVMQLMPGTAKSLGVDPHNKEQNIYGGLKYLKRQLDRFGGDWRKAAAAYNAGPAAVQNYGGIPPYGETKRYVARIGGFLESAPQYNGEDYSYKKTQPNLESVFGVEGYDMPTQSGMISRVDKLKDGWEKVIPQIGGVLKNKFGVNPVISSAARTPSHNASVNGAKNSYHLIRENGGDALDIVFDGTNEQKNQIESYFKNTGIFKEVLYHDAGSGYHLHLGGLNTDALADAKSQKTEEDSDIDAAAEESEELEGKNTSFVDPVIESLLRQNIEPNFEINRADTALTKAVYKEFVFSKMYDKEAKPLEDNKKFFEKNADILDSDGNFNPSKINNRIPEDHFGKQEIEDFGQKLVADKIAAIKNIQTPNADFVDSEYFNKKTGITIFESKLASELATEDVDEVSRIAAEYGGKSNKKGNVFSFEDIDSRAAFQEEVSNIIRTKKEISPVEKTQSIFGEIPPLTETLPPLNVKDFDELAKAVDEGDVDIVDNKWQNNSVVANYFKNFVEQKYKAPNAEYREELEDITKDGKFIDTPENRATVNYFYSDKMLPFVDKEFERQYEERQNLQQQAAQEQLQELQTKTDAAQAKLQAAIDNKDDAAIKKYGAELSELGEQSRNIQAQLSQIQPQENIVPPPVEDFQTQELQEQTPQTQLQNDIEVLQNTLEELQAERAAKKSRLTTAINEGNIPAAREYEAELSPLDEQINNTKRQLWQLQQQLITPAEMQPQENITASPVESETPNQTLTQEEIDELLKVASEGLSQEEFKTEEIQPQENITAPPVESEIPNQNLTQENIEPPAEIQPSKNFKSREATNKKTGVETFESALKTNLPQDVFSAVKKIAKNYGATLSQSKANTFKFDNAESRAAFEEDADNYIENSRRAFLEGRENIDEFKKQKAMTPEQIKKFEENISAPVKFGVFDMTRGELLKKISEGKIKESDFELNADEQEYLNFLRDRKNPPVQNENSKQGNIQQEQPPTPNTNFESFKKNIKLTPDQLESLERTMRKPVTHNGETMTRQELIEKIARGEIEESDGEISAGENIYLNFLRGRKNPPVSRDSLKEPESGGVHFKIGEHENTKTGKLMPSAELSEKVSNEDFVKLNELANRRGGKYSKVADKFLFQTAKGRDSFVEEASRDILKTAPAETKTAPPTPTPSKTETAAPLENKSAKRKPTGIFGTYENAVKNLKEAFGIVDDEKITAPAETKTPAPAPKRTSIKPSNKDTAAASTKEKRRVIPKNKFVNVFDDSDENIERLKAKLKKKFSKVSSTPMFDPEIWTAMLELGGIYIQRGINDFVDWTKKITDTLGEESKIWQPAIFEMLETMPQIDKFNDKQITATAETVSTLYDNGTTDFADIRADFVRLVGEENTAALEPMLRATFNGIKKFFETLDAENKKSAETKINFGDNAVAKYKKESEFTKSQVEKFEENMSKSVKYDGETMTRQELIEKIARGEIEESAAKINKGERQYLDFLRQNIVEPLKAIQNAGIAAEKSKQKYNFTLAYIADGNKTIYESAVGFNEQDKFSKDGATIKTLSKLAKTLGGKLGEGQSALGKDAFIFGDNGNRAKLFTKAANLFTRNEHLNYLQPAEKSGVEMFNDGDIIAYDQLDQDIKDGKLDFLLDYEIKTNRKGELISVGKKRAAKNESAENSAETKKAANNGEQDISSVELAEGYKTESGRSLQEADSKEFIIKPDSTKDFGRISEEIAEKANEVLRSTSKLNVQMESAPIRLQVGNDNFGYIHLVKRHLPQIQNKGFDNAIGYINHILNNFNQIYDQSHIHKNSGKLIKRFVLYSKGDSSKGFMPIDLELENTTDNYYTIVSAMPHNEKIKGELIFDGSSRPSTVAADGSLIEDTNIKSGVVSSRANAKTNSLSENITQPAENDNAEIENVKGDLKNESSELGQSGRTADGHQVEQPAIRAATSEGGQEGGDSATEKVSGQQRQTVQRTEGADTGTNAAAENPVGRNDTGESSARIGAGNGVRGSTGTVHATGRDSERGGNVEPRRTAGNVERNSESVEKNSEILPEKYNFRITEDNAEIGSGGLKTKFKQNIDAIKLLKQLEAEGRFATPEEQKTLAQYNGWGTLADAFTRNENWLNENKQLRDLLTDEEYASAKGATGNAFYTSPKIARAIWQGLQRLGFNGGRILDPSMGSGIFFGTMPAEIANNSTLTGVELDGLTGRIAQQLFQKAGIHIKGFQDVPMAQNYFDLAITNVPFSTFRPYDPTNKNWNYELHNFFFAKAMDKVRPGGFVAFITSTGTMQSTRAEAKELRAEMASQADLIAAFKLPSNTFDKNAGTQVTTDVLILQKRSVKDKPSKYAQDWLKIDNIGAQGENGMRIVYINEYFKKNLGNMIGTPTIDTLYAGDRLALDGKNRNVEKEFSDLMAKLPENIYVPVEHKQESDAQLLRQKLSDMSLDNFAFTEKDGKIYQNHKTISKNGFTESELVEVEKETAPLVRDYLKVKKSVDNIMNAEATEGTTDQKLSELRQTLTQNYDNFTKNHGYLNSPKNIRALGSDPNYRRVMAIENYKAEKQGRKKPIESASKADTFFKRTMGPAKGNLSADTAEDALIISISTRGKVDMPYMKQLTGKTDEEIAKELNATEDLLYKNPETNSYELAEEYLSGNVRAKLAAAEDAAKTNPEFMRNVKALSEMQPADFTINQISAKLGAAWFDKKYYEEFLAYKTGSYSGRIDYNSVTGEFFVDLNKDVGKNKTEGVELAGRTFSNLFECALNRRKTQVTYKGEDGKNHVDAEKTAMLNNRIKEITAEFEDWILEDETRKKDLIKTFNEKFGGLVERKYNGKFLNLKDKVAIDVCEKLYPHQRNAIWRIIQDKTVLLAHEVGAGKTWTMAISGYVMKKLGIIRKPLYAVPENMIGQFTGDFLKACPKAKLLVIGAEDLPKVEHSDYDESYQVKEGDKKEKPEKNSSENAADSAKRDATFARIATGDWDGIIISHDNLQRLPLSQRVVSDLLTEQKKALEAEQNNELLKNGKSERRYMKSLQYAIKILEKKVTRLQEKQKTQPGMTFEELGIDQIFVDESQKFKNLDFYTNQDVKGISSDGSDRALDMYLKTRWLTKNNGGVVFASGTPVSNSLSEIFTLLRYLGFDMLASKNARTFNIWSKLFGEIVETTEFGAADGQYKSVRKMNLVNLKLLRTLFGKFMDVVQLDDMPYIDRPKLKNGEYTRVIVDCTETQKAYFEDIKARANKISDGGVDPKKDNYLKLTGDGRMASLDMRLIDPTVSEEEAGNKIPALCENVFTKYTEGAADKCTQLIFLDIGVPKSGSKKKNGKENVDDDDEETFEELSEIEKGLYDIIKKSLIKRGIPAKEIAFIHDAGGKRDKLDELLAKVNSGEIRVLLGSREKAGAGLNMQKRVSAIHQLDIPWRPSDITQSNGRGIRAGNINKEVEVLTYATKGTTDLALWEKLFNKENIIQDFFNGDLTEGTLEEVSELQLSGAEMQVALSDDPLAKEKTELNLKVQNLKSERKLYAKQQSAFQEQKKDLERQIPGFEKIIENLQADIAEKVVTTKDAFQMKLGDTVYEKRADADAALEKVLENFYSDAPVKIGEIGGFDIKARSANAVMKVNGEEKVVKKAALQLSNHGTYSVNDSVQSMENFINKGIDAKLDREKQENLRRKEKLVEINKKLEKPFPHKKELEEAERRLRELDTSIGAVVNANKNSAQQKESAPTETKKPLQDDNAKNIGKVARQVAEKWADDHLILAYAPSISENAEEAEKENKRLEEITKVAKRKIIEQQAAINVIELANRQRNKDKKSVRGKVSTEIEKILDAKELNARQAAISEFSASLGVPVNFFKGDKRFHGAFENGEIYINADAETSHDWTFWHESFHWLATNNPALFKEIADAVNISQKQIADYKTEIGRQELTDAETIEEILADNMKDVASRAGLMQQIGKKNKSLVQRIISWLKSVSDKFTDFFNTPKHGLTREQKNKMYDALGKMARSIVDDKGNAIFRYNSRTKNIELANGEPLPAIKFSARDTTVAPATMDTEKIERNIKSGRAAIQKIIKDRGGKITAAMHRDDVGDIDILWGYAGDPANNFKKGYGIAHILARRDMQHLNGELVAQMMPDVIMKGEKKRGISATKTEIHYGNYTAILSNDFNGKPVTNWLLTGFMKSETGQPNERGEGFDSAAPTARTPTPARRTRADNPVSSENITQNEDGGNTKFSINNNSSDSLSQKIKNLLPSWTGRQPENEDYRKTITRKLKELTGYKIAYGHYLGKDAAFVDDLQKVIRSKKRYDFENILPKVGQVLAKNLNLPASEEMHNYIASWMLDGAPNNTSAEAKAFQKAMRDNPATFEILQEIQSTFQEVNAMTPMERTSRKIKNSTQKESIFSQILGGETYNQLVDDLNPINQLVQEIEKRRGKKFSTSENTYELARLFKGTGGISEMMVEGKSDRIEEIRAALSQAFPTLPFDNFKPLAAIIDSIGGVKNFEEFQTYCVACQNKDFYRINDKIAKNIDKLKREIRLLSKDPFKNKAAIQAKKDKIAKFEETNAKYEYDTMMTNDECNAIIKDYSAKYGAAQKDIVNFSRTLLQMLVASGVKSVDEYNDMLKAYPNYIPMHRVFDDNEKINFADSMKRRKGSAATVFSPIQTIIRNAYELPKRAGRNTVKASLANLARCGAFGDLIEEVNDPKPGDKTIITFYENGAEKYLQTAPEVVEAVETLQGAPQSTWIVKILTAATGAVRGLYTAFSPDFAAGNVFRDIPDAYLHNKYGDNNPLTTLLATWKGLMSAIHKDKIFYEWLAMCGAQSTLVSPDRDYTQSSVDKITKTQKERWLKSGVGGFFGQVLNAMQTFSEYSEYATRIGTYKLSKDALAAKNNDKATLDDMKAAAMMSRDATIDFARAGKSGRTINRYVAFSNAAIQGYDRTFRTFNPEKLKTAEGRRELFGAAVRLAVSSILPAIVFFALNHDEDWCAICLTSKKKITGLLLKASKFQKVWILELGFVQR